MKRLLMVLVVSLVLVPIAAAQLSPMALIASPLAGLNLTGVQQQAVATLTQARNDAVTNLQVQMVSTVDELEVLLDAPSPDLARIGTLSRQVRMLAAQDKQIRVQFRRDVWQLLTPAQRDVLLARLGF